MDSNERCTYINSQIAIMQIQMKIMEAENIERRAQGQSDANGTDQWTRFYESWNITLGHNAVIDFLNGQINFS